MKNKIALEYEKKMWYRITKSFYIFMFVILLVGFNCISFFDGKFYFSDFLIGNVVIVLGMGILEGLFWYIVNGKWGYPKDYLPTETNKR